jgi:tRNA uridine 5-carboxymethylaminomethyl modification enzyme
MTDVIVIGAGHAGCEAAWAAARLGCRVTLVTLDTGTVASMPCNPAIGGTAKGHLVREVDALGGLMGEAIDATGLQFKMLNRGRGPAVWSPRAQADKRAYGEWMRARLARDPRITLMTGAVSGLVTRGGRLSAVGLEDGSQLPCQAVVVTAGTFLNGLVHVGAESRPSGRGEERNVTALSAALRALGLTGARLKTGTPPRVHRDSIDRRAMTVERGDPVPWPFSFLNRCAPRRQVVCHSVRTTPGMHDLVRRHIDASPLYNGRIRGTGPRYCPSFEDKVMRFPDRDAHVVVFEPEGLDVPEIYVNGLSTSLPAPVQERLLRGLPGCAEAVMLRPGYAVEYDSVDATRLDRRLAARDVAGLFCAGQINGTSGYEEAAAQGIVAGANAALEVLGRGPLLLTRRDAYIGVLIDDLTTQGCLEPYRMFTSRAEHRLHLRADNADLRLTPIGRSAGLVGDDRWDTYERRGSRLGRARAALARARVAVDGIARPAAELLRRPEVGLEALVAAGAMRWDGACDLDEVDVLTLEADIKYEGYLRRQARDAESLAGDEYRAIPPGLVYRRIAGLSREAVERLEQVRPETLGQARRVAGVTPAAVAVIAAAIRRCGADGPQRGVGSLLEP